MKNGELATNDAERAERSLLAIEYRAGNLAVLAAADGVAVEVVEPMADRPDVDLLDEMDAMGG